MTADNVTPIRPEEPPEQRPEIAFGGSGEEPHSLIIWQGLYGVCCQLKEMGGTTEDLDQYVRLGAAASVLAGLLDDRLMLRPELQ